MEKEEKREKQEWVDGRICKSLEDGDYDGDGEIYRLWRVCEFEISQIPTAPRSASYIAAPLAKLPPTDAVFVVLLRVSAAFLFLHFTSTTEPRTELTYMLILHSYLDWPPPPYTCIYAAGLLPMIKTRGTGLFSLILSFSSLHTLFIAFLNPDSYSRDSMNVKMIRFCFLMFSNNIFTCKSLMWK